MTSNVLRCVDMIPFVATYFDVKADGIATKEAPTGEIGFLGSNEELIACACRAKNGLKFDALYNRGAWEELYPSKSEARAALYEFLTFYCGPNRERVEELYLESAMLDEKWLDRSDEQERLYTKAVSYCNGKYYEGRADAPAEAAPSIYASMTPASLRRVRSFVETKPPKIPWVLFGLLASKMCTLLHAAGGTGKSYFLIQALMSVASGVDFMHGVSKVEQIGKVLLVAGEDDTIVLHQRVHAIADAALSFAEPEERERVLAALDENLLIVEGAGADLRLARLDGSGNAVATGGYSDLLHLAKGIDGLAVIALDPLARFHSTNENDSGHATAVATLLERLARETGAALVTIHHISKQGKQPKSASIDSLTADAARGSTAYLAAVRCALGMTTLRGDEAEKLFGEKSGAFLAMRTTKSNYAASGEITYLRRDDNGVLAKVAPIEKKDADILADALAAIQKFMLRRKSAGLDPLGTQGFAKRHGAEIRAQVPKATDAVINEAIMTGLESGALIKASGRLKNVDYFDVVAIEEGADHA